MNKEYYKVVFNLSQEPHSLTFGFPQNISDFDLKNINFGRSTVIPEPVVFSIDLTDGEKELDVNLATCGVIIVSQKFKDLFITEPLVFYPIRVEGFTLRNSYYILEILDFCDCINEKESHISYWTEENAFFNKSLIGSYKNLSDIHLSYDKIKSNIFRIKKYPTMIIVSQHFVDAFNINSCSGLTFKPIS